jgi:hypothetical protein
MSGRVNGRYRMFRRLGAGGASAMAARGGHPALCESFAPDFSSATSGYSPVALHKLGTLRPVNLLPRRHPISMVPEPLESAGSVSRARKSVVIARIFLSTGCAIGQRLFRLPRQGSGSSPRLGGVKLRSNLCRFPYLRWTPIRNGSFRAPAPTKSLASRRYAALIRRSMVSSWISYRRWL